jgi:capsular polysaccharide biosynthesis protein
MELRQYWRILVRRRNVAIYTFLVVAILSGLFSAYTYYTSQWLGQTILGVQMQPLIIRGAVFDPQAAADGTSVNVEADLANYATTIDYFKAISAELKSGGFHTHMDYRSIQKGLKVFKTTDGHGIIIEWPSAQTQQSSDLVTAAAMMLKAYVPTYHRLFRPTAPAINVNYVQVPVAVHQSLGKLAQDLALRLAIGIIAAIVLAYLFEYLDTKVQDEADVQRWMGLPTLAVIPGGQVRRLRSA